MSEHRLVAISPRKDIAGANWQEVGCSCGWVSKYPSSYRCHVMHQQREASGIEMEKPAT